MELFPAIDLKGGQVVRLTQGDYNRVQVYADNPAETAEGFIRKGARNLHVVDLDGAKDGAVVNFNAIQAIVSKGGLYVEVGGGIRDEARIEKYLEIGVGRVILGTVAAENISFTEEMARKYGDRIAVGVDARDGKVAVRGWLETTALDSVSFCQALESVGVQTIIYTDISKDGAMTGTNLDIYKVLSGKIRCDIMASGGISAKEELTALRDMNLYGAILGKALYTGALDLEEVTALC